MGLSALTSHPHRAVMVPTRLVRTGQLPEVKMWCPPACPVSPVGGTATPAHVTLLSRAGPASSVLLSELALAGLGWAHGHVGCPAQWKGSGKARSLRAA